MSVSFVYYLLNKPPGFIKEFDALVEEVKKSTAECDSCHRIFIGKVAKSATTAPARLLCSVCADGDRDDSILMVVARDSDFESIERSGAYKGFYFILGGTVPILDKEPDKRIRLKQLLEKISGTDSTKKTPIKEIILSLNTTPDGEHTVNIVREALTRVAEKWPLSRTIKVTVLGRGLSTGAELEYIDADTIKNALQNRK